MARVNPPGTVEVWWEPGPISNTAAPSLAGELGSAVDLTSFARNVPSIPETGNTADISDLSSGFNKRQAASYGGDNLTAEFYMDDGASDTAYTTLTRGTSGFLLVAWYGLATAGTLAAADELWVYPVTIISRGVGTPGRDEAAFFVSEMAITDDPAEKVAIVA